LCRLEQLLDDESGGFVMNSVSVRLRYRPVRLGWCVRDQNLDDLRRAIRYSHAFIGGIFNPIIPVNRSDSKEFVARMRVDALINVSEDDASKDFVKGFDYLPWPFYEKGLFLENFGRWSPTFLDVSHRLNDRAHNFRKNGQFDPQEGVTLEETAEFALVRCEENDDPLRDLLLALFGGYPDPNEIHRDYEGFIQSNLLPFVYTARKDQPILPSLLTKETPSSLTDQGLTWDRVPGGATIGFYVGSASSFDDLVNFWNLRASGVNAMFLDPDHSDRLALLRDDFTRYIAQIQARVRETDRTVAVWSRSQEAVTRLNFAHDLVPTFNHVQGLNIASGHHPPLHYIVERRVLGTLSESFGSPTIAFQLPEKPFPIEERLELKDQHFVVSVSHITTGSDESHTFWVPFIPAINPWAGRHLRMRSTQVRTEIEGFGIICPITEEHLEIHAVPKLDLAKRLFEFANIKAEPSPAGRIATRLIAQLGGLQGARVLKLAGVRRLIKEHGALKEFGWKAALQTICSGTEEHPQPKFSEYEDLFLESRPWNSKLKPENVFHYLLEKGVFRPGLTLKCSKCELSFWVQLDDVATEAECLYCGNRFNCTRQLSKDPWQYRKSGLFGLDNNQEGGVPVALTLQQLDTLVSQRSSTLLMTSFNLIQESNASKCETDLFVAVDGYDRVSIAVGECKDAKGEISADDVRNMMAVADAFPRNHFHTYVIFAKTAPFTQEEIDRCKEAQNGGGRSSIILLSDRELEPYFVYERAAKDFEIDSTAISLSDLARTTYQLYFHPTSKRRNL
jgi:hypothetical protein